MPVVLEALIGDGCCFCRFHDGPTSVRHSNSSRGQYSTVQLMRSLRCRHHRVHHRVWYATIIVLYIITLLPYPLNYVLQCLLFCYVWWLCLAINTSVQHNGGLLPDIILLTQGQRVPRTVFFPCRIVPINLKTTAVISLPCIFLIRLLIPGSSFCRHGSTKLQREHKNKIKTKERK